MDKTCQRVFKMMADVDSVKDLTGDFRTEVLAHLSVCADCTLRAKRLEALAVGLRAIAPPPLPADFTARIMTGVRKIRQETQQAAAAASVAARPVQQPVRVVEAEPALGLADRIAAWLGLSSPVPVYGLAAIALLALLIVPLLGRHDGTLPTGGPEIAKKVEPRTTAPVPKTVEPRIQEREIAKTPEVATPDPTLGPNKKKWMNERPDLQKVAMDLGFSTTGRKIEVVEDAGKLTLEAAEAATVTYRDKVKVEIAAGTRFGIKPSAIVVESGALTASVTPGFLEFVTETPGVIVHVKGTVYKVAVDSAKTTTVTAVEHTVWVASRKDAAQGATLTEGNTARFGADGIRVDAAQTTGAAPKPGAVHSPANDPRANAPAGPGTATPSTLQEMIQNQSIDKH